MLESTRQTNTDMSAFYPTPMFDQHEFRGREEQDAVIPGPHET